MNAYRMGKAPSFIHDEPFNMPRTPWRPLRVKLGRCHRGCRTFTATERVYSWDNATERGRLLTITLADAWRIDIPFAWRTVPNCGARQANYDRRRHD